MWPVFAGGLMWCRTGFFKVYDAIRGCSGKAKNGSVRGP